MCIVSLSLQPDIRWFGVLSKISQIIWLMVKFGDLRQSRRIDCEPLKAVTCVSPLKVTAIWTCSFDRSWYLILPASVWSDELFLCYDPKLIHSTLWPKPLAGEVLLPTCICPGTMDCVFALYWERAYFGGIAINMWTWSPSRWPSTILLSFSRARSLRASPRCFLRFPYNPFFLYFGIQTKWYLQSHVIWDKLLRSCIESLLFCELRAIHEWEAFVYSRKCQTLRVSPAKPGVYSD
jgi:hypothetical protein